MRADPQKSLLPMTREEMSARGWHDLDVLLVTGDGYFDHPSHGAAVIGRVLEAAGYTVGIVARPDWRSTEDFTRLGRPALFAGVTAGAVDSLINNWTADLKRRRSDAYAPGGVGGGRPDFATLVYANRIRQVFPDLPVVLGGIEASLRRFAYFDPLKNAVRRSILVDSRADLLVYGPGESQVIEIAKRLETGKDLEGIAGTARLVRNGCAPSTGAIELPEFVAMRSDPSQLLVQTRTLESVSGPVTATTVCQRYEEGTVWQEPRNESTVAQLDRIFALPFSRRQHPGYDGEIPALGPVRWSVISHRGCPGGCSFCGISMHQGRQVVPRSPDSVLQEIAMLAAEPDFKGTISDVGGPTANAFSAVSKDRGACSACKRPSCLYPQICRHIETDCGALCSLLKQAAALKGIKRVLVASGIRFDMALADTAFIEQIARFHTGGHLKVAPEHVAPEVLKLMRKPPIDLFEKFEAVFRAASARAKKEQYLVPYFISGFPGCDPRRADLVSTWLARRGQRLRQVQNYIPLPGTAAAAMYAARTDFKGDSLYVADMKERRRQKSILVGKK